MKIAVYLTPAQARFLSSLPDIYPLNQSVQVDQLKLAAVAVAAKNAVVSLDTRIYAAESLLNRYNNQED